MTLIVSPSSPDPSPERAAGAGDQLADPAIEQAVARLHGEYAGRIDTQCVRTVVRAARRDLGGSPVGALPELVERLARYRLGVHVS
ncbi:three-helix bundle dimerization domain-containing protein [Blastococcus sp. CCUG 61487]|uniref:three-helix bundle dimerization domain-containing protein n=1 Tax=Blastococcus sp. CCUG 61487 TaxID=1840703 RepID=UPI0010C03906|nr:hypothetical protein [Blastococcus sp. CCUG 61487]TKJ35141.1 hypothetical protein A6V29_14310 [Blastococcus sp. CCUG 61487]